jgi:hypothetical protein
MAKVAKIQVEGYFGPFAIQRNSRYGMFHPSLVRGDERESVVQILCLPLLFSRK